MILAKFQDTKSTWKNELHFSTLTKTNPKKKEEKNQRKNETKETIQFAIASKMIKT